VRAWLKVGYFTESQEASVNYWMDRTWVSDSPGRASPRWKTHDRPTQDQDYPPFGPQYEVGDRLVVYITGRGKCPAILEVSAAPRWDPDWVDAAHSGEGERWGVVTDVEGIASMDLHDAPDLQEIGVSPSSIQRKGHVSLEPWQYELAKELIGVQGSPSHKPNSPEPTSVEVPVEAGHVEGYDVMPAADVKRAVRRESLLVRDYSDFLKAKGDSVSRNKLPLPDASHSLYTDLFNKTRGHLIEAKAGTTRGDIRMAIGQLADYARHIDGVKRRAVLLEAKPHPDLLDLLASQDIAVIWRSSTGFADNAGGAFT
jgi:hypothetical protein